MSDEPHEPSETEGEKPSDLTQSGQATRADAHAHEQTRGVARGPISQDDPIKRRIQYECWFLCVNDGKSFLEIAAIKNLDRKTVAQYVRLEQERQEDEEADFRGTYVAQAIERYRKIIAHYTERMSKPDARGDEGRYIIQAQERIDKLRGLEAPFKVKDETPPSSGADKIPASTVFALLAEAAKRKREEGT